MNFPRRSLLAAALPVSSAMGQATGRVALVIGNGAYRSGIPSLSNPPRDADAMGRALERLGFTVEKLINGTQRQMLDALGRLANAASGKEAACVFFAGHAAEIAGQNLLFPVSMTFSRESGEIARQAVAFSTVTTALSGRARATLIFLDACRDNPLAADAAPSATAGRASRPGATRSTGGGLVTESPGVGVLIAFATAPGQVALDGTGANSPFTQALLRHITTPNLEVREMLGAVRRSVREATSGQQIPWDNSSLEERFVFASFGVGAGLARGPGPVTMQAAARHQIPLPSGTGDLVFWRNDPPSARFVGSWSSEGRGWNGHGRSVMVIVIGRNAAQDPIRVVYGEGPATPTSHRRGPAFFHLIDATISDSVLTWFSPTRTEYQLRLEGDTAAALRYQAAPTSAVPDLRGHLVLNRIE